MPEPPSSPHALLHVIARVNALRAAGEIGPERTVLERAIEGRFRASHRLAVYGTLAPGESNADQLAGIDGEWTTGDVRGRRYAHGWGMAQGYPAFRYDPGASAVPVRVLTSPRLAAHWRHLDAFEGAAYRRILVPVYAGAVLATVANIYEALAHPFEMPGPSDSSR